MDGRVKTYNSDRGFGFILDEDGNDRFFHVSSVKSIEEPARGARVTFKPAQSERGLVAQDIQIKEDKARPQFYAFGDVRLKLSNIKNYGIAEDDNGYYKYKETDLSGSVVVAGAAVLLLHAMGLDGVLDDIEPEKVWVSNSKKYLYVTTYQGDNYRFEEGNKDFDIVKACADLDELLVSGNGKI